jgi:hypothetical protein|tara:strand:+ start:873 stop:1340 length:468 start_codon:yes stop_codon:yes gene_type:complete
MAKKKIMYSKCTKQGYWEHAKNKYKLEIIPIKDLWASVPKAEVHNGVQFYKKLSADIKANGLINPLLTVTSTYRELLIQKSIWKDRILPVPFKERGENWEDLNKRIYVIWGGSNRVEVAKDLGYTHIECAMMLGFKHARSHQQVHRQPWQGNLYV